MAITYPLAVTTQTFGAVASFVLAVPSGVQNGDLLIVHHTRANTGANAGAASHASWTNLNVGGASVIDDGTDDQACILWRIANNEPADYTFSQNAGTGSGGTAAMLAYRGVDGTTPIPQHAGQADTSANTTFVTPEITTTDVDAWVLAFFSTDETATQTWSGGGTNERYDFAQAATSQIASGYDSVQASPATVSKTGTLSASDTGVAIILALKPAGGSPPPTVARLPTLALMGVG